MKSSGSNSECELKRRIGMGTRVHMPVGPPLESGRM